MYATTPLIDALGGLWNGDIFTEHRRYPLGRGCDHSLPGYSINVTLGGWCRFGDKSGPNFIASAGDVVFVEPRKLHLWRVVADPAGRANDTRPWHVLFCGFVPRPTWAPWLQYPQIIPGYARLRIATPTVFAEIRRAFIRMHQLYCGTLANRGELQMNLLEHILLWCQAERATQVKGLDPRVQRAVEYLSSHLHEKITLEMLAGQSQTSRARLAAIFRAQVGDSPMRFLEMCRLLRAKELLRLTGQTIDAIAATVGFCDAKYFAARFHRRVGMTPSAYRESV